MFGARQVHYPNPFVTCEEPSGRGGPDLVRSSMGDVMVSPVDLLPSAGWWKYI